MPFWRLFYHLVWATKHRSPLLTPAVEEEIYPLIRSKTIELGGTIYALDGAEDHTHLVGAIPPNIAVSRFVGQVKGVASSIYNKTSASPDLFYWQDDYSAFSCDGKRLSLFIAYVDRQKILSFLCSNGPGGEMTRRMSL
jgi:REP element-mobilizing transposase RayT